VPPEPKAIDAVSPVSSIVAVGSAARSACTTRSISSRCGPSQVARSLSAVSASAPAWEAAVEARRRQRQARENREAWRHRGVDACVRSAQLGVGHVAEKDIVALALVGSDEARERLPRGGLTVEVDRRSIDAPPPGLVHEEDLVPPGSTTVAVTSGSLAGRASARAISSTSSGLSRTMRRKASSDTVRRASSESMR
jgi:hypothetical protein